MSLRSKLQRLEGRIVGPTGKIRPAAPLPAPLLEDRSAQLDELRARMSALLERTAPRRPLASPSIETSTLPFLSSETPRGPLHQRILPLSAAHRMGRAPVATARGANGDLLALLALDPTLATCDPARALYLDTETTGLHGGTGTIAFLVGLAYFSTYEDGAHRLVVEQLLVRNLGEEAAMLERVAELIRDASMLVTFNGKSFDLPLLRTRFVMARIEAPVEPPHLDLLHVARRLHKSRKIACRLTTLEQHVLGFERHDDVPGGEVSACYLHFLRTGEERPLLGVIEHNTWDVVAMAALVGLYGEPLEGTQLEAVDLAEVARTMMRVGKLDHAYAIATQAVDRGGGAASLRARAQIAKARGDRIRALADFEALAEEVDDGNVRLELAKLYEHFRKEPHRALEVVLRGTSEKEGPQKKRTDRLGRKISRRKQQTLFGAR